jgi:hypothetical protein
VRAVPNIFPTSKKIHFPNITKAKPVNAVKETIGDYSENHMKHENAPCGKT